MFENLDHSKIIKLVFWPIEVILVLLILVVGYMILSEGYGSTFFYELASFFGVLSFLFFTLSILSGMLSRFGIKGSLVRLLATYRRETGKLMFIFAAGHYLMIKIFPMIAYNLAPEFPLYQAMGFIALMLSLPLFFTSNNWAQRRMGKYWKLLHSLVYVIAWFIFLHVALLGSEIVLSVLIFLVALAETLSILNYKFFKFNLS